METSLKRYSVVTTDFILSAVYVSRALVSILTLGICHTLGCEEGKGSLLHHHGDCNALHPLYLMIIKTEKFACDISVQIYI